MDTESSLFPCSVKMKLLLYLEHRFAGPAQHATKARAHRQSWNASENICQITIFLNILCIEQVAQVGFWVCVQSID